MAALQESLVGFLINRYLGDLFVGKCEIDNLKVKFTEGYASVSELRLNTEYINENLEKNGINLQLMEGYIGKLTVIVPFTSILEKSSEFVMDDVALSFQPRNSGPVGAINDIVSSMIGSMATSRELANEFFASEPVQQKDAGVESCEQLIAAVMSRIVFKVTNVMLRIETSSPDSDFCTAIECHIDSAKFVDEQLEACENQSRELRTITSEPKSIFSIASLNKLLHLTGVKFYTDITSKDDPTMSMSQQYTSIYQRRERERNKSKCSSSRTTEEFEFDFAQSMEATTDSFQSCYSHISTDDSVPKHVGSRETECLRSNPLKFGHLIGDDNVVKFSTTNSAVNAHPESTPKSIDIELNFQGLELFMNPSQMFIVKQIMDLILMPKEAASEEDSAAEGGRPMSKDDFRNIATMQNNTQFQSDPVRTAHGNLAGGQWAGTDTFQMTVRNREEEIMDDEFDTVNLASLNNERIRRLGSSVSSESSYETRTLCDSDKADTTRLRANIASFVMIVPHKDPWSIDAVKQNAKNGHMPLMEAQEEAVEEAREHSEKFFSAAADIRVKGVLDLKSLRTKFSNLYPADHLLITGWPFNIDLTLTKEPQNERTEIVATASQLDCCEFLMASSIHGSAKSAHFDIFSFDGICETNNANLILKVDASSGKDVRNNVILALGECSTELDISIIDRLSNFIAPNPFFAEKKSSPIQADDLHLSEDPWDNSENVAKQLNFELRMPSWTVNFRIPKADLRSAESSNRLSYCVKNVHPEILQLKFEKVNLKLPRLNTENLSRLWEMKLTCSSLTGAFKGDLSVLKCSEAEQTFLRANRECFIRENEDICLELKYDRRNRSLTANNNLNSVPVDPMMRSVWGSFFQSNEHKDGPFSQKVVMRDNETLTMVGERDELMEFGETCRSKSNLLLSINAPILNVSLPSHMFFEVLYNRLLNDLLLWAPCSPVFKGDTEESHEPTSQNFQPCKSTLEHDSDNESLDSNGLDSGLHEGTPHDVSVTFDVDRFSVLIGTTVLEDAFGMTKGQVRGRLEKTQLFVVSGYHGDPNLMYFYISSDSIGIYHQNLYKGVTPYISDVLSQNFASRTSSEVICVEPLDEDCPFINFLDDHRFALSMKIECTEEDKVIVKKDLLVASALQNSQLHVTLFQHASDYWVNQLLDFFKVTDYEVPGYVLPECVYQVRFNARSTLISYAHNQIRENSQLRLKLAVGSCDLSCQIVDDQQTIRFQCILEDSKLQASNEHYFRSSGVRFDSDCLSSDEQYGDFETFITLVCLGYFELEFSLGSEQDDASGLRKPRFDIKCKNDEVKAYFCADSLSTLINAFGDIFNSDVMKASEVGTTSPSEVSSNSDQSPIAEQDLKEPGSLAMTAAQEEILRDHLSNAMIEVDPPSVSPMAIDALNQNYAFFPEEESLEKYPPRPSTDCEDFCPIDEHPGHAVMGPSGEPSMRPFGCPQPGRRQPSVALRQERFYKPSDAYRQNGSSLVQGSTPIVNINIKDITIRLFIYGGNDFGMEEGETKTYSGDIRERERKRQSRDQVKGGNFRDETVMVEFLFHKISYRSERYGPESDIVSASMVSMYNMEIIDHLSVSKINQMLYQDKTSDCHRRSNVPIIAMRQVASKKQGAKVLVSALPIRMNIDQDSLEFLIDFFAEVSNSTVVPDEAVVATEDQVVTQVKVKKNLEDSKSEGTDVDDDHSYLFDENDINFDEDKLIDLNFGSPETTHSIGGDDMKEDCTEENALLMDSIIKEFTFTPAVTIKIDYVGKRVKTDNGALMGLLIGMSSLHCTEIKLKELNTRKGVATLGRCFQYAAGEWLNDIRNHQLPNIFGSYGPLSSITQLAGGVRDLVVLPVDEFRKVDGHVVKGIQRGAGSFGVSALAAVVDFTQGIASAIQGISEIAFHIVSPDYPNYDPTRRRVQNPARAKIPNDLRAGLSMAFDTVRDGVYDTADVLQMAVQEDRAEGQWFRRLLQQLAPTVIRPIVLGSRATVHVLGGLRSQLQPDQHIAEMRKWRD